MLTQTLAFCMCLAVTGQNPINGNQLRVACDRNGDLADTTWWYGTGASPIVAWQRDGVGQPNHTISPGIFPDVDSDDYGNTYIAYQAGTPPSIYLSVDFNTPILISGSAGGTNPTVTVCRGKGANNPVNNGQVAVAWTGGGSGGGGIQHGTSIMAATYNFANGVLNGISTPAFQVNANVSGSVYSSPDISSDVNGNYVITYARSNATSSNGICAAGFQAGTQTPLFSPTEKIVVAAPISGSFFYTQPHISCFSDGESVVLYNVEGNDGLVALHVGATGNPGNSVQVTGSFASGGSTGYYPNNAGVAALRSTPGSYVVTWAAPVAPNGQALQGFGANILYRKVVNDTLVGAGPTFVTSVFPNGTEADTSYGTPSVALADAGSIFIVWSLNPFTNGPPTNYSISPVPTF
jgi:hypothetical protein